MTLTPPQLLAAAERLVGERHYAEAKPLVVALRMASGYKLQTEFLSGLIAARTGRYAEAAERFTAILADDPRQTRVRLELAQALLALGKSARADRQLRLAQQDVELPDAIARTIRTARDTIRSSRAWRADINFGLAPDTNINNATSAQSVAVQLGGDTYQADLNDQARARSGLGETAQFSGGLRLPVAPRVSALAELDAIGTNYRGTAYDDAFLQGAAGAEYRLSPTASLSLEGVAAQRWFGGHPVTRQAGARGGGQATLSKRDRVGVQIDVRHQQAFFDRGYDGWQGGLYVTGEHVLARTIVLSVGPFARRESLREDAYSSTEVGANLGVGGELPHGVNVAASVGASRAWFDAAIPLFDVLPRRDTRVVVRTSLGLRSLRVYGFSPQVNWTWNRIDSSLGLYSIARSRFEFTLARYF